MAKKKATGRKPKARVKKPATRAKTTRRTARAQDTSKYDQAGAPWWKKFRPAYDKPAGM